MSLPPPPLTQSNAPLRQSLSTNANPLPPPPKTLTGTLAAPISASLQRPVSARATSSSMPPETAGVKAGFMRPLTAIPQAKGALPDLRTINHQLQFNKQPRTLHVIHNHLQRYPAGLPPPNCSHRAGLRPTLPRARAEHVLRLRRHSALHLLEQKTSVPTACCSSSWGRAG